MKKIIMLCALTIVSSSYGYLTHEELEQLKKAHALPENKKAALDELFTANPDVKAVFTADKMVRPSVWGPGPELLENPDTRAALEKQGFYVDPSNPAFLLYKTEPNKNFPGTFDATKHVWQERPTVPTINIGAGTPAEQQAKLAAARAYANPELGIPSREEFLRKFTAIEQALTQAELKNGSNSGNITVALPDKQLVLRSSWRAWTTYPQVASALINGLNWKKHLAEKGLSHVDVPTMYLYHIPGQPEEFNEKNWMVVAELIQEPLSVEEVKEAITHVPPYPFVQEVQTFLDNPTGYWKDPVNYTVNSDGTVAVDYARFKLVKDQAGDIRCIFTNPEMPSIAGAHADEDRSARLSTEQMMTIPSGAGATWKAFVEALRAEKEKLAAKIVEELKEAE